MSSYLLGHGCWSNLYGSWVIRDEEDEFRNLRNNHGWIFMVLNRITLYDGWWWMMMDDDGWWWMMMDDDGWDRFSTLKHRGWNWWNHVFFPRHKEVCLHFRRVSAHLAEKAGSWWFVTLRKSKRGFVRCPKTWLKTWWFHLPSGND